ncbi:hypothetical protein K9F62_03305 [Desulfovibrio sp. JY]|nr:hypothetical protein K9F62_03305 [Desulfovibrio sp. JY]
MTRRHCPISGRLFVPYHLKDKTCGRPDCQRQRALETRLERLAILADAAKDAEERQQRRLRTRRLYERGVRREARLSV